MAGCLGEMSEGWKCRRAVVGDQVFGRALHLITPACNFLPWITAPAIAPVIALAIPLALMVSRETNENETGPLITSPSSILSTTSSSLSYFGINAVLSGKYGIIVRPLND